MTPTLSIDAIIRRVRRWWPTNVDTLLESCDFPLRFIGAGAFRKVYEIVGTGYVIKVPNGKFDRSHSETEHRVWKRISRSPKYKELRKYMPAMMYFNRKGGCLVMPKYDEAKDYKYDNEMDDVADCIHRTMDIVDNDVSSEKWDNWGVDADGNLVMLDLGCLEGDPWW